MQPGQPWCHRVRPAHRLPFAAAVAFGATQRENRDFPELNAQRAADVSPFDTKATTPLVGEPGEKGFKHTRCSRASLSIFFSFAQVVQTIEGNIIQRKRKNCGMIPTSALPGKTQEETSENPFSFCQKTVISSQLSDNRENEAMALKRLQKGGGREGKVEVMEALALFSSC